EPWAKTRSDDPDRRGEAETTQSTLLLTGSAIMVGLLALVLVPVVGPLVSGYRCRRLASAAAAGDVQRVTSLVTGLLRVDPNACGSYGDPPLVTAVRHGQTAAAGTLLTARPPHGGAGANVDAVARDGQTALHIAIASGNRDLINLLVN